MITMTAPKQSFHELYDIYCAMKDRCYRERSQFYYLYGKLGVRVCDRWLDRVHGFENFVLVSGHDRPRRITAVVLCIPLTDIQIHLATTGQADFYLVPPGRWGCLE
jgi:hypothetical protein